MSGRLILVLGDQLSPNLSSLRGGDRATDVVLMAEVAAEADYVPHHRKKLAFVFSTMRHFAAELAADGWRVDYVRLDDAGNSGSLGGEVRRALARHGLTRVVVTEPGERPEAIDVRVNYIVYVPEDTSVSIEGGNGNVFIGAGCGPVSAFG